MCQFSKKGDNHGRGGSAGFDTGAVRVMLVAVVLAVVTLVILHRCDGSSDPHMKQQESPLFAGQRFSKDAMRFVIIRDRLAGRRDNAQDGIIIHKDFTI